MMSRFNWCKAFSLVKSHLLHISLNNSALIATNIHAHHHRSHFLWRGCSLIWFWGKHQYVLHMNITVDHKTEGPMWAKPCPGGCDFVKAPAQDWRSLASGREAGVGRWLSEGFELIGSTTVHFHGFAWEQEPDVSVEVDLPRFRTLEPEQVGHKSTWGFEWEGMKVCYRTSIHDACVRACQTNILTSGVRGSAGSVPG